MVKVEPFVWEFPFEKAAVYIECDLRFCYAYVRKPLERGGELCGDTWLFNVEDAHEVPEWEVSSQPPFANSTEYCRPFDLSDQVVPQDFGVTQFKVAGQWLYNVFYRDVRIGCLWEGSQPGMSIFATQDGPLAKALRPD